MSWSDVVRQLAELARDPTDGASLERTMLVAR
jgi:hypothetical protein